MIDGTLLLIGRETAQATQTIEDHAERLREKGVAGSVRVVWYDDAGTLSTNGREQQGLGSVADDPVFLVPMTISQSRELRRAMHSITDHIDAPTFCCEPIGQSSALTDILADHATRAVPAPVDASLILVGFGSSSAPHQRQTVEFHERRLDDRTDFDDVISCYLLQDPAVECARYNVSTDRVVAVPVFISPSAVTREEIPDKLATERGSIEYTAPIGTNPRLSNVIYAEVMKQYTFITQAAESESSSTTSLGPQKA